MTEIRMIGKVTIRNGDRVIVIGKKNKVLRNSLRAFTSAMLCNYILTRNYKGYSGYYHLGADGVQLYFGKSNTANTYTTDDLVSKLDANANIISNTGGLNIQNTYASTTFAASWNAGVLNALLTGEEKLEELALYFYMFDNLTAGWIIDTSYNGTSNIHIYATRYAFSRIVLGANAFIPDINNPVIVEWEIGVDLI